MDQELLTEAVAEAARPTDVRTMAEVRAATVAGTRRGCAWQVVRGIVGVAMVALLIDRQGEWLVWATILWANVEAALFLAHLPAIDLYTSMRHWSRFLGEEVRFDAMGLCSADATRRIIADPFLLTGRWPMVCYDELDAAGHVTASTQAPLMGGRAQPLAVYSAARVEPGGRCRFAKGQPVRSRPLRPAVAVLREQWPAAVTLRRIDARGREVGRTWHADVAAADEQMRYEFGPLPAGWARVEVDRKSTRLNSSHT